MKICYYLICLIIGTSASAQTYPVAWTNPTSNVTINGDNSVTKNVSSSAWDAAVVSQNSLFANQDGYLQLTHTGGSDYYSISLSRMNTDPSLNLNGFAITINGNSWALYRGPNLTVGLGSIAAGDVLRFGREGATVKVYRNSVLIQSYNLSVTVQQLPADVVRLDASIYNGTMPVVVASFRQALFVKAGLQHPDGLLNNNGAISLQVEGQYTPVTYSWSSGETTSSISGKARGTYAVTVTDAQARVVTRTFNLGYAPAWSNQTNVTVNADNSLTKTIASATWDAGASSVNTLPGNSQGWMEFVLGEPGTTFMAGLTRIDKVTSFSDIDFAWYLNPNGRLDIYESGALIGNYGSFSKGDVLRLERIGNRVNYFINGVSKRQGPYMSTTMRLVADVSIFDNTTAIPVIATSFNKIIRLRPQVILPDVINTGGGVSLVVEGTYTPSSLSWSSGETTPAISGKSRGTFTVTATDATPRTTIRSYRLGHPVLWTDLRKTTLNVDNSLTKTTASAAFDGGGISSNILPPSTDGYIEFIFPTGAGTNQLMIGLSRANTSADQAIDYAFYFNVLNEVFTYEGGSNEGTVGSLAEGDVYTIAREGTKIKYYVNGTQVRSVTTDPTFRLFADVSIVQGTVPRISASFSRTPGTYYTIANGTWTNPTIWSLTEGGPPANLYPANQDMANIKGYNVTVDSGINCINVDITANNANTSLIIDGILAALNVNGIVVKADNNVNTTDILAVQNEGRISIQNP